MLVTGRPGRRNWHIAQLKASGCTRTFGIFSAVAAGRMCHSIGEEEGLLGQPQSVWLFGENFVIDIFCTTFDAEQRERNEYSTNDEWNEHRSCEYMDRS
jgi:hypothetical protein